MMGIVKKILLTPPPKIYDGSVINLPLSKSIANRMLILNFLSQQKADIPIPDSHDSQLMKKLIDELPAIDKDTSIQVQESSEIKVFSAEDAGTVFRFLSALFAITPGKRILTGSSRMLKRPCGPLINSLQNLGAQCQYLELKGYPPVLFDGTTLQGGEIEINASVSSQFISALMIIAPEMEYGLKISWKGSVVSYPYIQMTALLMEQCGISVELTNSSIKISSGNYSVKAISEPDWSAASYWFALASLLPEDNCKDHGFLLSGLTSDSAQGDRVLVDICNRLGVSSEWESAGLRIRKWGRAESNLILNLKEFPDLAPAIAVACAALQLNAVLTGLESLKIKESDRLFTIQSELNKQGYRCEIEGGSSLRLIPGKATKSTDQIETYKDHRIAMAMSLLTMKQGPLIINDPDVVNKSYPGFWRDLESVGFKVNTI